MSNLNSLHSEIYTRHMKTVFRVCYTYMKNVPDTEDAVADTFVKLIKRNPSFKSDEHEKAWLIRTATNVCKDGLKQSWRRNRSDSENEFEQIFASTEEPFEAFIRNDAVAVAVMELPEKYKTVIYMYYFEGYDSAEISKMLKKPQSTVRNNLLKAKNLLRERLGDFYE
ncbi:MAG: sigma-70 family RNA polymerase sigma factor [Oscillospiraceae bacterium]|nr:sigma-70 family RNA polymerase sigma factor [Oscillospiraceae bacterium]